MRLQGTPTGVTLYLTKRLWVHWFRKDQRLPYVCFCRPYYSWGDASYALHLPWLMVGVKQQ